VLVDMRSDQPTYGSWWAETLSSDNPMSLLVPPGIAHGYQTLSDDTVVSYLICGEFRPKSARTLAWNDPTIAVPWPLDVTEISESDRNGTPWPVS
jgi:dTDP-4-dehydrorhamnose 3,5-epimerase